MDGDEGHCGEHRADGPSGAPTGTTTAGTPAPELADLRRYGSAWCGASWPRRAQTNGRPSPGSSRAHLETSTRGLPLVEERWASYEHLNVQAALDAWLAEPGRSRRDRRDDQLPPPRAVRSQRPDRARDDDFHHGPDPGNVSTVQPADRTGRRDHRVPARRGPPRHPGRGTGRPALPRVGPRERHVRRHRRGGGDPAGLAAEVTDELRDLALEHNVYRGQVVSFGGTMFGERGSVLRLHARPDFDAGRADPARQTRSRTYVARWSAWRATGTGCARPDSTSSAACCSTGRPASARHTPSAICSGS